MTVIGRIGAPPPAAAQPVRLSDAVRALLGVWMRENAITHADTEPNAIEQAIVAVLDGYQQQTDARIARLEAQLSDRKIVTLM